MQEWIAEIINGGPIGLDKRFDGDASIRKKAVESAPKTVFSLTAKPDVVACWLNSDTTRGIVSNQYAEARC